MTRLFARLLNILTPIAVVSGAFIGTPTAAIEPAAPYDQAAPQYETAVAPAFAAETAYISDFWVNVSGGRRTGVRYLNNIDAQFAVDLERLGIVPATRVFVYGLYNNGEGISADLTGDAQVISNIEASVEAGRLYEAWVDHVLFDGAASLRAGLYDLNSEFDVLEAASLFINSAHGIGTDIGQTGRNGPSIFPVTSLGVRGALALSDGWTLRVTVLDGAPGDPERPERTTVQFGDGALVASELEYANRNVRLLAGRWRYTSAFDDFNGRTTHGNNGFYFRGEASFTDSGVSGEDGVVGFVRFGTASVSHNDFNRFYSAGLVWRRAFVSGDAVGAAVAIAEVSPELRRIDAAAARRETAIELTYSIPVTDWFSIQPDIQYVIHPGARRSSKNALAIGIRTVFSYGREW